MEYVSVRNAPEKRRKDCTDGKEKHLTEAAVMIAFAMHLLKEGATEVAIHPDGEHGKKYPIRECLESRGFVFSSTRGTTSYGGEYRRGNEVMIVWPKSGLGDVTARINNKVLCAECKGGVINSRHAGQTSRLRKGLCEALGQLMIRPLVGERHVAVVPKAKITEGLAGKILTRATAAGIEIALVDENGGVGFLHS